MLYHGVAIAPDGNRIASVSGTIQECSNWADNLIRSVGECRIDINLITIEAGDDIEDSDCL